MEEQKKMKSVKKNAKSKVQEVQESHKTGILVEKRMKNMKIRSKYLSVSRQVNSLFQTEFSKDCDLELPPSTSSIFLFP
jgi:hypothetical protein